MTEVTAGLEMYSLATELFPICRSISGNGVRESLKILQREVPCLKQFEVPSGTRAFDWEVPREWNVEDAYVISPDGEKIIDFKKNNLYLVGYSIPIDRQVSLEELSEHLFSIPEQPDAIPYMTSYYKEVWGFCISHRQRQHLKRGVYQVKIASQLKKGSLTLAEAILPGETSEEIFLSTYCCHPSMANNEVSGPVLAVQLLKWIQSKKRRYTYRIAIVPETIGALIYLSRNLDHLRKNVRAGFQISCVGDDRGYSYLSSRDGGTLADRVAQHVLKWNVPPDRLKYYSFLDRGSDERQYCSPGVDLPVCSVMRTKHGEYPEYHTSLDNLDVVSPMGFQGAYQIYTQMLEVLEANHCYRTTCLGEPQLGKRGLYPNLTNAANREVRIMMDVLAYCDGTLDLIDVAEKIKVSAHQLIPIVGKLREANLLEPVK